MNGSSSSTEERTRGDDEEEGAGDGEGEADAEDSEGFAAFGLPIAHGSTTLALDYGDVREDRVVLYGTATPTAREFVYALKATHVGSFVVPPIAADALYDRSVVARGTATKIVVTPR